MFVVEFFARGSVPSVRDVLADSVAEAEATASNASKGASSIIGCTDRRCKVARAAEEITPGSFTFAP